MSLPVELQKQVDSARALREQVYGEQANPESQSEEGNEPSAAPAAEVEAQAPQAPEAIPPQGNPATPAEDENSQTYAQRWRTLQGVYNATKQRLDESSSRIANLEQLFATMQSAPAPVAPASVNLVTDSDAEAFGADQIDLTRRVAREENHQLHQTIAALTQRIEQLSGMAPVVRQVAANQQVSAEEGFLNKVGQAMPDWASVNDNPAFHRWLLEHDSMTGIKRQIYLEDAQRSFDLQRVVSIFQAWKREAGVAPVTSQVPTQQQSNISQLERQVAPGRASAASAPPAAKTAKQYLSSDITKFFDDRMKGKFKGREAEMRAMEADIFLAQREGRIVRSAA